MSFWNREHRCRLDCIAVRHDMRRPTLGSIFSDMGEDEKAKPRPVTIALMRCPKCGKVDTQIVDGHWSADEMNGKPSPDNHGEVVSKFLEGIEK